MSMKAVEMQIAIPRTSEVGKIQNEFYHRSGQDQQYLAAQRIKESQEMSQRSESIDEAAETAVREQGRQQSADHSESSSRNQTHENEDSHDAEHPYKGHHLDVSF